MSDFTNIRNYKKNIEKLGFKKTAWADLVTTKIRLAKREKIPG
jgi:hypothetical protein